MGDIMMRWESPSTEQPDKPQLKTQADMIVQRLKSAAKIGMRNTITNWNVKLAPEGLVFTAMRFPYSTERLLGWEALKGGVLDVVTEIADQMEKELAAYEGR